MQNHTHNIHIQWTDRMGFSKWHCAPLSDEWENEKKIELERAYFVAFSKNIQQYAHVSSDQWLEHYIFFFFFFYLITVFVISFYHVPDLMVI